MGKVIVEKLLRDVKDIKSIYFFLRPKKRQTFNDRLVQIKNEEVFQSIRQLQPTLMDKLRPIQADLTLTNSFGVSNRDLKTLSEDVSFVIHAAATVKFNESLEDAIRLNTLATRDLIRITKTFKKLEAFTYVSSTYSNCHRPTHSDVKEIIHDPAFDYRYVNEVVESGDMAEIKKLSNKVLKQFPNTYTLSKHISEQMIKDLSEDFPVNIVRPSIISPTVREPKQAWLGFSGTLMGINRVIMTGQMRSILAKKDTALDVIPCDLVANSIVTACAEMASSKDKRLQIYNCSMGIENSMDFGRVFEKFLRFAQTEIPSTKMIWYPRLTVHESRFMCFMHSVIKQWIPAIIFDMLSILQLKKPQQLIMQKRLHSSMIFKHFFFNDWNFDNKNLLKLQDKLSIEEK